MAKRRPATPAPATPEPEPKSVRIIGGEIKTPPIGEEARREIGRLIRDLQNGESLGMPRSRPMPIIGSRVHELRVPDGDVSWRVFYRIDEEEIVIIEVVQKREQRTPQRVIDRCIRRLKSFDAD